MADFPNSTTASRSHSRRSVLRGLAAALAGASVPVAAIAGLTAKRLVVADSQLLAECDQWHDRRRRLQRVENEMERVARENGGKMPPKPRELFEPIDTGRLPALGRWVEPKERHPMVSNPDGSWGRERLEFYAKEYPHENPIFADVRPSPACRAHCRNLLALMDEREAEITKLWAPYDRLNRIWERDNRKNWRLFVRITSARAETLQGISAQMTVVEREGVFGARHAAAVSKRVAGIARNLARLVDVVPA